MRSNFQRAAALGLIVTSSFVSVAAASELRGSFDETRDLYIGGSLGASVLAPSPNKASTPEYEYDFSSGFAGSAFIGRSVNDYLRVQADMGYFSNELTKSGNGSAVDGDASATYLIGSVYYELPLFERFSPYVGIGAGVSVLNVDFVEGETTPSTTVVNNKVVPTGRLSAGASYQFGDAFSVFADYSYLQTLNFNLDTTLFDGTKQTDKSDLSAHLISTGVRYHF